MYRTANKIALMEAKLRQLSSSEVPSSGPSPGPLHHPSLPAKPPPVTAVAQAHASASARSGGALHSAKSGPAVKTKPKAPLSVVLPQLPSSLPAARALTESGGGKPSARKVGLVGVKMKKAKPSATPSSSEVTETASGQSLAEDEK
jgi:hypothetical protein